MACFRPTGHQINSGVQWVGVLLLLAYCTRSSITVHPAWSIAYVVLNLGVSTVLYTCIVAPAVRRFRKRRPDSTLDPNEEAMATANAVYSHVRKEPWKLLMVAGEDGVFFLPLLYIGISPVAALSASFAYAVMHYQLFPLWACGMKWLVCYIVAIWILPHGIMTVVVGHLINDGLLFVLTPHLQKLAKYVRSKVEE
jgi:hypothetical protein